MAKRRIQRPHPLNEDTPRMTEIMARVKRQLRPALAFFEEHFDLLCEATGVGGVGVFLSREELRGALDGATLEPSPFVDFPGREYELVAGVDRIKDFCKQMRATPEGFRRCCKCDLVASTRAVRTKRSQCYECHAGLTDLMAPIVVHGAYVGVICVGQFFRRGHGPQRFEEVWERVSAIPGLDRERLRRAYGDVATLDETGTEQLLRRIEDAARNFAELWENIVTLVTQEKQLGRIRLYQERDFAEMLLGGARYPREEALARARSLGLSDMPNAVLVVQLDPASDATVRSDVAPHDRFAALVEAVHGVRRTQSDAIVTSISVGEVVLMLRQNETRNPELQQLRLRELADRVARSVLESLGCAPLVGASATHDGTPRLADAYQAARRAMWLGDTPPSVQTHDADAAQLLLLADEIVADLREAVRAGDGRETVSQLERGLRLLASVPEHRADWRRALHSRVVETFFDALRSRGMDDDNVEGIRVRYLRDSPSMRTIEQMGHWTREHICTVAAQLRRESGGQEARIIERACALVRTEPDGGLDRAAVAERFGLSEGHFGRVFRRRVGMPYRRYVLLTRVALAQQALLNSTRPVSDIALEVGYSDTSAFTRAFTKACGVSPRAFREAPFTGRRIDPPRSDGPSSGSSASFEG